jgi:hypothetical protein
MDETWCVEGKDSCGLAPLGVRSRRVISSNSSYPSIQRTGTHSARLVNLTPADVYHGRGAQILKAREEIKKHTIRQRRLQHQTAAA